MFFHFKTNRSWIHGLQYTPRLFSTTDKKSPHGALLALKHVCELWHIDSVLLLVKRRPHCSVLLKTHSSGTMAGNKRPNSQEFSNEFTKFMMGTHGGSSLPASSLTPEEIISYSDPRMKKYMDELENQNQFWGLNIYMKYNILVKIGQGSYG